MSKYFHPKSWKDESLLRSLQEYEPSLDVKPESCICRNCRTDVSSIGKPGFVPRWRKSTPVEITRQCYVSECTESVSKVTTLADKSSICHMFDTELENSQPAEDASHSDGTHVCVSLRGMVQTPESFPLKV